MGLNFYFCCIRMPLYQNTIHTDEERKSVCFISDAVTSEFHCIKHYCNCSHLKFNAVFFLIKMHLGHKQKNVSALMIF